MDPTQEELDFLSFFDMCFESIKIISSCKKIFLQITLTLIIPLLIIFLWHSGISMLLINKIVSDLDELGRTKETTTYNEISDVLNKEYVEYWISEVAYFIFLFVFFLLSTSIVVYTVARVYTNKQTTYKKVMSFAIKVWNRLMITLLSNFVVFIVYNIIFLQIVYTFASIFSKSDTKITRVVLSTIYVVYFVGFIYISVIWQLSSVISVLEKSYGFQAIAKSKALIKGKMGISAAIFLEINLCLGCIHLLFDKFVVFEESFGVIGKVGFGVLFLVLRSLLFLFGLVVQTLTYFKCKSSINRFYIISSLSTKYYNIYVDSYVPIESIVVI